MDFKSICQNKTKNDWAKYSLTKLFLHMPTVIVSSDNKSMFTFQKSGRQLIANLIRFFRRDFTWLEGLAQLVGDHFIANPPTGDGDILIARKQKLLICGFRGAGIR